MVRSQDAARCWVLPWQAAMARAESARASRVWALPLSSEVALARRSAVALPRVVRAPRALVPRPFWAPARTFPPQGLPLVEASAARGRPAHLGGRDSSP